MAGNYYDIAGRSLSYLQKTLGFPEYNDMVFQMQQVSEKMLKSVVEAVCPDPEDILKSHNLKRIYREIKKNEPNFKLEEKDLSMLKDYYFDARYPGDDYIDVTKEECVECLDIMYDVIAEVNRFREARGMEISPVEEVFMPKEEDALKE